MVEDMVETCLCWESSLVEIRINFRCNEAGSYSGPPNVQTGT